MRKCRKRVKALLFIQFNCCPVVIVVMENIFVRLIKCEDLNFSRLQNEIFILIYRYRRFRYSFCDLYRDVFKEIKSYLHFCISSVAICYFIHIQVCENSFLSGLIFSANTTFLHRDVTDSVNVFEVWIETRYLIMMFIVMWLELSLRRIDNIHNIVFPIYLFF